jgi:hypothetical protein
MYRAMNPGTAHHSHDALRAVVLAGSICGVLDGLSALAVFGYFGAKPARIFQGIASALLGRRALQGGGSAVLAGIALHFLVAFGAAAVYYVLSRWLPFLIGQALLWGAVFGVGLHCFMQFVVIPLTAIGHRPFDARVFLAVLMVHAIVVGPSISLTIKYAG